MNDIIDKIKQSNNIILLCHKNPDGDAIGSSLAMCLALNGMGKNVDVVIGLHYGDEGKGLMTEAVKAVSEYLLKECEFNRVYCMVRESNHASNRVCEKAGMKHEGFLRNHWIQNDGSYTNVHYWGLLSSDI